MKSKVEVLPGKTEVVKKVDEKYEMAPTGLRTHFSSRACCKPSLENVNRNVMQHWKGTAYAVAAKENAHID